MHGDVVAEELWELRSTGWSDFNFFAVLENGHIAIDWLYF